MSPRQTLLFSATVPPSLTSVVSVALLPGYKHLSALKPEDENTHARVPQTALTVRYGASLACLQAELEAKPGTAKIIVFSPTARGAEALFHAAQELDLGPTWQIQSCVPQRPPRSSCVQAGAVD